VVAQLTKPSSPWITGLACAIGLTLGLYFLGAGLFDLCYTIGPIGPNGCASGSSQTAFDSSLVAIGILLTLLSLIAIAYSIMRRGSAKPDMWMVWFSRSVFVIGTSTGLLIIFGTGIFSAISLCDPYGPFGTVATLYSFDPYEVIGPLLTLVSLIGLAYSVLVKTRRT